MQLRDLILVSVDDHLIEPQDMFVKHMPARFKDRAPVVRHGTNGAHHWQIEGQKAPGLGLNAVAGRPKEEYGFEPVSYEQVRAGCYDVAARVGDMDANGVLGSICFGSFPGFAGARFQKMQDKDLALATIQAYNDWHIHDWCGRHPGRFIPLAMLPLWDVGLAVAELKRMSRLGCHAVTFPENPALIGLPSLHNEGWEPLWAACEELEVVLCCHIGSAGNSPYPSDESPIDAWITAMPISIANAAADWLFAGFWKRYPGLRMALSEGGIGWIPYFLERADFTYAQHGTWTHTDFGKEKPSDVFRRHVITCFIDDDFGLRNRQDIGIDIICWEADYPHSDATWPNSPEHLWRSIWALPSGDINKITHENAMRAFHYDPISIFGRDNCTVGALRARSQHVDTRPVSRGGLNPAADTRKPVTSADIKKILAHV
jgi:predicted TIM-barrel fold metal-dependent hydrolase